MKTRKLCACLAIVVTILFAAVSGWSGPAQDILRATLANGLRIIIIQNTLAPVVTTQLNYLAGANESPEGFPGMAHAQEHMMFRGSPGLSAEQLASIITLAGGEFNADTEQTVTRYYFTVAKEHLDIALNVEAARMRGVLDSQEIWEQERGAIEQEVARDLSNPEYVFSTRLIAELFAGTPYAHDALGTRPSFQQTTGVMLKEFYDRWYAPNNAVLIIAGDVDFEKTLAKVKELFEPIPRRPVPVRPEVILQPLKPAAIALDTDLPYGLSVVAYRLPGFASPDFAAGTILADVLDSHRGNLYALVPDGKALLTGFDGEILPQAGYGYALAAFPQGDDGNGLVATIKEIIAGYVKEGIPPDLVEAAKRHEVANAEFRKNSVAGLANAWSQAVAVEGRNSPEDDIEAIKRVTVEEVNRVAGEYLNNDTAITAVLTPRHSGTPTASKGYGGGESFAPNKVTAVKLPVWAGKVQKIPDVPPSRVKPVVSLLPNGIRLIVQRENITPTVTVIGRVKHNDHLQEPAGKEGVSLLLNNLFSRGTLFRDRLAFQKAQDDIGAEITAGASFSLRVLSESFERGMELLAENILKPALPEADFSTVKEEAIGSLRGQLKSPRYLSGRALREGLFPQSDPALRDATPETVATVSLPDVKAYHARVFRPDMTTIVVIGNVTAKRARAAVKKYFSAWKAVGRKPKTDLPAVPPNKPSQSVVPDLSSVQDSVTLAQTIGITRKHPDYYTLELGNHILSGAFYASRLYRDLREKTGLVYTVGSSVEAGRNRSLFRILYGCDPPNVAKARAIVENNLRDMQAAPVTAAELRHAKILLLKQITLAEASTDGIAMSLLTRTEQDLPLDEPLRAARLYRKMTARQLREAFGKWIRPQDFVQVTEGPDPQ